MSKSKNIRTAGGAGKISRRDICETHSGGEPLPTDRFYVNLANRIYPSIRSFFADQSGVMPGVSKHVAVTLACYVEDLVSGTGVWPAFTSLYRKEYGTLFPFYNLRESGMNFPYDDEMPSFHAVLFLLWYIANDYFPDMFLNPNNPDLRMLAMRLLPDLVHAFEDAPDTPGRPMIISDDGTGLPMFFQIRDLCEWLTDRCYLTRIRTREQVTEEFENYLDLLLKNAPVNNRLTRMYAERSFVAMNALIGPLAIPAYEWLAEIVGLYPEPEEEKYLPALTLIKSRPYDYYRFVTVGATGCIIEDLDGEKLTLSADTLPDGKFSSEVAVGKSAIMSIVFFDGAWHMNGFGMQGLPPEVFEKPLQIHHEKQEERKEAYKRLLKALGGKRMGVCDSYDEYMKLTHGDNAPTPRGDYQCLDELRNAPNLVYFLDSDGLVNMMAGWAPYVKIEGNIYYDPEKASKYGPAIILDHTLTTPELRQYIIKNKLIPDAALSSAISPEAGRQLFQRNIRFLNDYSSRDTMTFMARL